MVRPKRRSREIVWRPFHSSEPSSNIPPWYLSKTFLRFLMAFILVAVYALYRSWIAIPVKMLKANEFFDKQGDRRIKPLSPHTESRFMASITSKPPPAPLRELRVMDSAVTDRLMSASHLRYIQIRELEYCKDLNGAMIDGLVHLNLLGGSIGEINPTDKQLARIIDSLASGISDRIFNIKHDINSIDAKRYSCYSALEGSNPNANLSASPLLHKLPWTYMSTILPGINANNSVTNSSKSKKFQIAYLIMLQELHGFHQMKFLIEALKSPDCIFLIHVPQTEPALFNFVSGYLEEIKNPDVHLQTQRYSRPAGHINLLYAILSGIYELMDLADWEYFIDLSNYDFPLGTSDDIYSILKQEPGVSYLDTSYHTDRWAAMRWRPYLGLSDGKNGVHLPELGIGKWYGRNWGDRFYQGSEYVMLTREACMVLRYDEWLVDLIAPLEFIYNPQEVFFATILGNSESQKSLLYKDKRRFSKARPGQWVGWKDKDLFPPGSNSPPYLFFRPFNAQGDFFGEKRLKEWVEKEHFLRQARKTTSCDPADLGSKPECFQEIASGYASGNHLVLIPVDKDSLKVVSNVRCSLSRAGVTHILHWALDKETQAVLIGEGLLVYYNSSTSIRNRLKDISRARMQLTREILNAGFHLLSLEIGVLALRDFRPTFLTYVDMYQSDIVFGILSQKIFKPVNHLDYSDLPPFDPGLMYIRNTESSLLLFDKLCSLLEVQPELDGTAALAKVLQEEGKDIIYTGIGTMEKTVLYPEEADGGSVKERPAGLSDPGSKVPSLLGGIVNLFNFYSGDDSSASSTLHIHFFDQSFAVTSNLYFNHADLFSGGFSRLRFLHIKNTFGGAVEKMIENKKELWFLDDKDLCIGWTV